MMADIYNLMLDETRQNFFQVESWISFLDLKAFGIIAINAILVSFFAIILTKYPTLPYYYLIPCFLLVVSSAFMLFCIWPRKWKKMAGYLIWEEYRSLEADNASQLLAEKYAENEKSLYKIYDLKLRFFKVGLVFTVISFVLNSIVFFWVFEP